MSRDGLVLAVVSVARAYANVRGTPEQRREALAELGAFARIYERVAAKSGSMRLIRIRPDGAGRSKGRGQ